MGEYQEVVRARYFDRLVLPEGERIRLAVSREQQIIAFSNDFDRPRKKEWVILHSFELEPLLKEELVREVGAREKPVGAQGKALQLLVEISSGLTSLAVKGGQEVLGIVIHNSPSLAVEQILNSEVGSF